MAEEIRENCVDGPGNLRFDREKTQLIELAAEIFPSASIVTNHHRTYAEVHFDDIPEPMGIAFRARRIDINHEGLLPLAREYAGAVQSSGIKAPYGQKEITFSIFKEYEVRYLSRSKHNMSEQELVEEMRRERAKTDKYVYPRPSN